MKSDTPVYTDLGYSIPVRVCPELARVAEGLWACRAGGLHHALVPVSQ